MTSDTPGSGTPGWGKPPDPAGQEPASEGWPPELVPPGEAPSSAAPDQPAPSTGWGTAAAPPPAAAPAPAPSPPVATQQGATPPPGWGAPPPQQPPGYGAPASPSGAPAGQWAAPPPQQPGTWAPPPGAPGAPPAGWAPAPAKSSNGCLKACLIVGIILVILAVILVVGITLLGMRIASDIGVNSDGTMQQCEFVSNDELAQVLDGDPTGMPLGGLVDATIGQLLDKRLLPAAKDCWLVDNATNATGYTGRMALQQGGSFDEQLQDAQQGGFYAVDLPGYGDQAFCTGLSEAGSTGALVRKGNDIAYVSLIAGDINGFNFETADDGVLYSPDACTLAGAVALQILK